MTPGSCNSVRLTSTIENNFYFHSCLFSNLSSSTGGSAIYMSSIEPKLLIELCTFHQCKTVGNADELHGGAVFISFFTQGDSVLNNICVYECNLVNSKTTVSSMGLFALLLVKQGKKNEIHMASITGTDSGDATNAYAVLYMENGIQMVENINSSANTATYVSFLLSVVPTMCTVQYANLVRNVAKKGILFYSERCSIEGYFVLSNVISNVQNEAKRHLIRAYNSTTYVSDCHFYNNNEYLFYSYGNQMVVETCYIVHNLSMIVLGSISFLGSNRGYETNIYNISFLSEACPTFNSLNDGTSNQIYYIAGAGVSVLIILGITAYFCFRKSSKDNGTDESSQESEKRKKDKKKKKGKKAKNSKKGKKAKSKSGKGEKSEKSDKSGKSKKPERKSQKLENLDEKDDVSHKMPPSNRFSVPQQQFYSPKQPTNGPNNFSTFDSPQTYRYQTDIPQQQYTPPQNYYNQQQTSWNQP